MSTYASDAGGGKDFDPVPEGSHLAICDMFVDLGMQDGMYGAKHKIYLHWQIPALRIEWEKDGVKTEGPMGIGATYTLSLSEKSNLRPLLQSWRGRAFTPDELKKFDVTTVVGAPCMLSVFHDRKDDGKVFAKVGVAAKLPVGVPAPKLEGDTLIYDTDNPSSWDRLRPWMQEKIKAAVAAKEEVPDMKSGHGGAWDNTDNPDSWRREVEDDFDSSVPF